MKKITLLLLAVVVLASVGAMAQTSVTGTTPVTLKAVVPEFLAISGPSVSTVNFDFTPLGTTKLADHIPSWSLMYNLANKTVTVCAYVTPLTGADTGATIDPSSIYVALGTTTAIPFSGNCGGQSNAVTMDTINNATYTLGKAETFSGMFITVPGTQAPTPDTYTGQLNVLAQAQ